MFRDNKDTKILFRYKGLLDIRYVKMRMYTQRYAKMHIERIGRRKEGKDVVLWPAQERRSRKTHPLDCIYLENDLRGGMFKCR